MLKLEHVSKVYKDGTKAVDDVDLSFEKGEFIAFIGTSGSGKTTTMRMINRMIEPSSGKILINGKNIMDQDPVTLRRSIGYVIQQIGLLPHMTIRENIVMVPKLLKWDEQKKNEKAIELIKLVDLPVEFLDRYPGELSGGQQQRIGVVRALAADQDLILMDEPFGALDPITRESLQDLIKELQKKFDKTIVFVTHDMDEAIKLADRIVIMHDGKVVQFDTPENILRAPADHFVEEFIGQDRLIQARETLTTVEQIMLKNPVTITPDKSITEAIKLMRDKRVDTLLVTDKAGHLKGFVDVELVDYHYRRASTVGEIYDIHIFYVKKDSLLRDTVQRILKRGLKNVPVVDEDNKLVGIVTRASLVDIVYDTIWGDETDDDQEAAESTETQVSEEDATTSANLSE